jgi:hypothetical protein
MFDGWLVLSAINLLLICSCWRQPLGTWKSAATWGLCGGLCVLINPILGETWAVLSLGSTKPDGSWRRLAFAALLVTLVMTPWTVRNYLVSDAGFRSNRTWLTKRINRSAFRPTACYRWRRWRYTRTTGRPRAGNIAAWVK